MKAKGGAVAGRGRLGGTGGQALTEAAIMMSLLAFAWAGLTVTSFMTSNGIRTASAARHLAWMEGNGLHGQAGTLDGRFYDVVSAGNLGNPPPAAVRRNIQGVGGVLGALMFFMTGDAYQVYHTEVTFNPIGNPTGTYPYVLLDVEFPILWDGPIGNVLAYNVVCEWPDLSDTFSDSGQMFSMLGAIFGL
jgi:hypothetical protein